MTKHVISNGIDAKKLRGYIANIEKIEAKKKSAHGVYMRECQNLNSQITDEKKSAANDGVPKSVLNAVLGLRKTKQKAEDIRESLEPEMQDLFDQCVVALKEDEE